MLRLFVGNVERELRTKDNHTWTLAGWTPTTTSSRFQLVSQVACLDANSGCSRWGDRSFASRSRSPSFAPVVVVVDLAALSLRASRLCSLPRPLLYQSLSHVVPVQVLALRSCAFFLAAPTFTYLSLCDVCPVLLCHLTPSSPSPCPCASCTLRLACACALRSVSSFLASRTPRGC